MSEIAKHLKNVDKSGRAYAEGRAAFDGGKSITSMSQGGVSWDHAAWLTGYIDALAGEVWAAKRKDTTNEHG